MEVAEYYDNRLRELGVTEKDVKTVLNYEFGKDGEDKKGLFQFFRCVELGIDIYFWDIFGNVLYYEEFDSTHNISRMGKSPRKEYKITRLANPIGDMKYKFPKGVGETYPWIPPTILSKYKERERIKTLYLTEGVFKAYKASLHGLDIVGLTSITHYKDKNGMMYRDVIRIIQDCKVENVVMLYDADCINISKKDLLAGEDISRRPNTFYNSMCAIYNLLIEFDVNIFFAHILNDIEGNPKGLDDLYIAMQGHEDLVTRDLLSLSKVNNFTYKLNLRTNFKRLRSYFGTNNHITFFEKHKDEIKANGGEFIFFGSKYKLETDERTGEIMPTLLFPSDLNKFFRVGDDYYELVDTPTPFGETEEKLTKRSITTIKDDFGKDAIKHIKKYKAFVNIPDNQNYKRIINNCYNTYNPIMHEVQEGSWQFTKMFLEHIFGKYYEIGLDYITILYRYPTEILPVLCLVSTERRTGKTTFLDWLCDIFGDNACVVGNEEFKSQFNGVFLTKLIMGLDETSLADNREITERIKWLSTTKKIPVQKKGVDFNIVDNFCHLIMCSNQESNFVFTEKEEVRYFVLKIPSLDGKEMTDLRKRLQNEIPAFLYYIQNRTITNPKKSRQWFAYELTRTNAFEALCENQKPRCQKIIEQWISDTVTDFGLAELKITKSALIDILPELRKWENQINDTLKRIGCEKQTKTERFKIPYWGKNEFDGELSQRELEYIGKPFIYKKKS